MLCPEGGDTRGSLRQLRCPPPGPPTLPLTPPCPFLQVNTDPFGEGWMIKVKLSNKGELDELMDSAAYSSFCESGGH